MNLSDLIALAATLSPDDVNYGPSDDPYMRCGTCSMFTADVLQDIEAQLPEMGHCSLVRGIIDPQDVCDRYDPRDGALPQIQATGSLSRVTALADVHSYEREDRFGREVNVRGYLRKPGDQPYTGKLFGKEADEAIARGEAHGEYGEPTGYFRTSDGKRLWGWHGAAGALVRHTDEHGTQRYLLQKRARWVDNGGTWSVPGGAADVLKGGVPETPEQTARRETAEEGWKLPADTHVSEIRTRTFGESPAAWSYHTVVMDVPHMFHPGSGGDSESTGHGWFTPQEMASLPLHPHFRETAESLGMPVGGGDHPVPLTALSRIVFLAGGELEKPVKGYERFEHGKEQFVSQHGEHFKLGEKAVTGHAAKTNWVSGDSPKDWNYGWKKLQENFKEGELGPQPRPYKLNGFFLDSQGHKHWGWYGGAGVLVHHTDEQGVKRYLLQKRASFVQEGGSYSTPGGAIDAPGGLVELPEAAAMREYEEEWGKLPPGATVTGVTADHHGEEGTPGHWAYHTVEINVPQQFKPQAKDASHGFESGGSKWVTPEEMSNLKLHSAFVPTAVKLGMPPPPPKAPRYKEGAHVWDRDQARGAIVTQIHPAKDFDYPTYSLKDHKDGTKTWTQEERYLSTYQAQKATLADTRKLPDDYPAGSEVTWRYQGKTVEGKVTGPSEEKDKNNLPVAYHIEMASGAKVKVPWGQLRPKSWQTAETKPGPIKPAAGSGRLKVESAVMPGLRLDVPAQVSGKPVLRVYEHPKQPGSVVLDTGQGNYHPYSFKEKRSGPGRTASPEWLKDKGFLEAKIADSGAQGPSSSGSLNKVVAAHEAVTVKPFKAGDRVLLRPDENDPEFPDGVEATVDKEITPATAAPGKFLYALHTDDGDKVIAQHDELEKGF